MTTVTQADEQILTPVQATVVCKRKAACVACSQCSDLRELRLSCDASRHEPQSFLYDQCPLRKWPVTAEEMPSRPAPTPTSAVETLVSPRSHRASLTPANCSGCPATELFVYGFPGLYAGANTELHHQILLWRSMGIAVHLIPSDAGYRNEPLYQAMTDIGVIIHDFDEFQAIPPGAPVLGFCNVVFLQKIDLILERSHNTVFVNCMTWLFDLEKYRVREGKLAALLYQNDEVRVKNEAKLKELNPDPEIQYLTFKPYFASEAFPFYSERNPDSFTIGRISRQDADKFSASTLDIWESVKSPVAKQGMMLGFGDSSIKKIGHPPDWIETHKNQSSLSQQAFYRQCDVILQPTDTTENWPRIGLEAMASGSVLIVDNRGGWRQMVDHGVTGWLCDDDEDFVRYATMMAEQPSERQKIALAARRRLDQIAGKQSCADSWRSVLTQLNLA